MKNQSLKLGFISISLLFFIFSCTHKEKNVSVQNQPNIVVIIADDLGWHDVGYHGSEIKTPVIDNLADEGIQLDRFYVHSVCSPTRASLLTGRASSRYGILSPLGDAPIFPEGTVTIAELLKRNGYETAISGKWHLGTVPEARPMQFGFNSSYGYLRGQIDPYTHLYKNGNRTWHKNDVLIDEKGHATDLITDEAIRVINESNKNNKPLFIYIAYSVPHYPLAEPAKWIDIYEQSISNESRRLFAASVTHMDYSIGRIMTTLDKNKMLENTVIVFLSDNGGQKSWQSKTQYDGKFKGNDVLGNNKPLRDWKTSLYDGALRVPAVISWKGKLGTGKVAEAINVADLFPTFASLAGANIPEELNIEGIDFWSSLSGNSLPETRVMYWRMQKGMVIKKGDWKLIHHGQTLTEGTSELFNISTDPYETENSAAENELKVAELKEEMKKQFLLDNPVLAEEIQ